MRIAINDFTTVRYALVSGPVFTVIFSIMNLCSGSLADKMSRKNLMSVAAICASLTSVGTAYTHTFKMVCFYRALLGFFVAFCAATIAYSLITDFFPPERRTVANSIYSFSIFVAGALSSLTVLIISSIGWRGAYVLVATLGILAGVLSFFVIKEPKKGRFEVKITTPAESEVQNFEDATVKRPPSLLKQYLDSFLALIRCRGTLWILLGSCCRAWQSSTMAYYSIKYFNAAYNKPVLYGTMYAAFILVGGSTSTMLGGFISDKYDNVFYRTKSYVAMAMSLFDFPFIAACYLCSFSFYFSMVMLFFSVLCEGWIAPTMSMI